VIERRAAGASDLQAGERVFGVARTHGASTEYAAVAPVVNQSRWLVFPMASPTTDEHASALPIPAIAALRTLDLPEITPGQVWL
jgi:NADPH:quinone reductase-like Zn-dependent oxidoreductase